MEKLIGRNLNISVFISGRGSNLLSLIKYSKHKNSKIKINLIISNNKFSKGLEFAKKNKFSFPYLNDETQEIAKTYDAVCTPDFFGYNKNLELQYRGRLRELKNLIPVREGESDLFKAMKQISETQKGPENQTPSMGCNIKWI